MSSRSPQVRLTGCPHHWTPGKTYTPSIPPKPPTNEENFSKHVSTAPATESLICRAEMVHFIQTWNNSSLGAAGLVCIINFPGWHGQLSWHIKATADHLQGVQHSQHLTKNYREPTPPLTSLMNRGINNWKTLRFRSNSQDFAKNFKYCCELHTLLLYRY